MWMRRLRRRRQATTTPALVLDLSIDDVMADLTYPVRWQSAASIRR